VWTRTLSALGGGWTSRGRSVQSLDNPVTDVLFSVGARLHSPRDPHQHGVAPQTAPPTVTRQQVPPLVTARPSAPTAAYGRSPYRNQELLLGSRVYTPGTIALHDSQGRPVHPIPAGYRIVGDPADWRRSTYKLESSCPAGQEIFLWAPGFKGNAHLTGQQPVRYVGRRPTHRAALQPLGTAPPGGRFTVWLRALEPGALEPGGIGCLDRGRLAAAEQRLAAGAATRVHVTDDGISARLPSGSRGFAVIAAPAISGWNCSAGDGASHPAGSYLGLLSVPLGGRTTSVSCTFTPPGLHWGEAVGGASLLGVAGLAGSGRWRGRRRSSVGGAGDPGGSDEDAAVTSAAVTSTSGAGATAVEGPAV
jgi:hypothetical protein